MRQICFRGLRPMSEDEAKVLRNANLALDIVPSENVEDSPLNAIFAPDPVTGNPSSDLYFDCKSNNELRKYIEDQLQSFHLDTPKTSSVDDALTLTKSPFESREEFVERVRSFVSKK